MGGSGRLPAPAAVDPSSARQPLAGADPRTSDPRSRDAGSAVTVLALTLLAVTLFAFGVPTAASAAEPAGDASGSRLEKTLVPLFGGDTDVGLGIGVIASMARVDPTSDPFRWKIEGAAFATAKLTDEEGLTAPFQDIFVVLARHGLFGDRLRLQLRPSFTRETNLRYFGVGNASQAPDDEVPARDFFTRTHPTVRALGRVRLGGPLHLLLGTTYIYNWISYQSVSRLASDLARPAAPGHSLLLLNQEHGVHLIETGLVLDTRDNEVAPTSGQYHQIDARLSPWQTPNMPYRYLGLSANLRLYLPLGSDRIVLATRLVGDILIGDAPLYELSRFDESSALGGARFVRGIPTNRYYGKRKILGNVELRTRIARFRVARSDYQLGLTGFADGGRVWADDLSSAPALDGSGLGIHYGVGGGLRIQKGETFVLRADLAWSPDARPVGAYLLAGQLF